MKEKKDRFRERKPLLALALSFILTGLGQVYNGKPRKGACLLLISILLPLLILQLSVVGPGRMLLVSLVLSLLMSIAVYVFAAVDAWKQAKRIGKDYRLKAYNRLAVYLVLAIGLNLFYFGGIADPEDLGFWAQPYRMSSGSMLPTLLPGDLVMTDRRINRSAENHGLRRGELVVFKFPPDKNRRVVKRVIGLPGDEIEIRDMELYVNGERRTGERASHAEAGRNEAVRQGMIAFYEDGDSGTHVVSYLEGGEREDLSVIVPEGRCFVLGDYRDNSMDSRHWGMIPLGDVVGRAKLVYFSIDPEGGVRWRRIGKLL